MRREKIRSGDDGFTDILGEGRVPKYDIRIETLGAIDEATSALGLARANCDDTQIKELLEKIQRILYRIMAEVAASPANAPTFRSVDTIDVQWLDGLIKTFSESRESLRDFILPGDTKTSSMLDLARVFVRRAERRYVELASSGGSDNHEILKFLNHLSVLLFELELNVIHTSPKQDPTLAKK